MDNVRPTTPLDYTRFVIRHNTTGCYWHVFKKLWVPDNSAPCHITIDRLAAIAEQVQSITGATEFFIIPHTLDPKVAPIYQGVMAQLHYFCESVCEVSDQYRSGLITQMEMFTSITGLVQQNMLAPNNPKGVPTDANTGLPLRT